MTTDTKSPTGAYVRQTSTIRGWITADGSSAFPAEDGRYRLIISYACPWAHRALLARVLLALEDRIAVTAVEPVMDEVGWRLRGGGHLIDVYRGYLPDYAGRATVPLLVDDRAGLPVSNESADILRMLDEAFASPGAGSRLRPARHAAAIDALNAMLQTGLNDGVYRVGFARSAAAREAAMSDLRDSLAAMEARLDGRRFLVDDVPLEPDWRLWVTLIRWEPAYLPFLLGIGAPSLGDYPALARLCSDLAGWPGVGATLRLDEIVAHFRARMAARRAP